LITPLPTELSSSIRSGVTFSLISIFSTAALAAASSEPRATFVATTSTASPSVVRTSMRPFVLLIWTVPPTPSV
jgi:hypothetical protein